MSVSRRYDVGILSVRGAVRAETSKFMGRTAIHCSALLQTRRMGRIWLFNSGASGSTPAGSTGQLTGRAPVFLCLKRLP